jgi:hypothetical protein
LYFDYLLFGLVFRFNLSLPQLLSVQSSGAPADVEVHLDALPPAVGKNSNIAERTVFVSSDKNESNQPTHCLWKSQDGSFFRLEFCDGTQFWLDSNGKHLWSTWPQELSLQSTLAYLLGPVLGFLLRLRGVVCLHASAVAVGNRSAVFVGTAGAGKSTTAAAFAREGCAVLSDDVVALDDRKNGFVVQPSYPHVLLWPDSVQALFGSMDALPRVSHDWDKRRLALGSAESRYQGQALLLGGVYILGRRREGARTTVEPLGRSSALIALVANSYAAGLLEPEKRALEFAFFGKLLDTVPVRSLAAGAGAGGLADLRHTVEKDLLLV